MSDIDSAADMSKPNKIMKALDGPGVELGLVKNKHGTLADDRQSSIELLLQEHFPGSTPSPSAGRAWCHWSRPASGLRFCTAFGSDDSG